MARRIARRSRHSVWRRRGSPISRKGPRRLNARYKRNNNKDWSAADVRKLRRLARGHTPAGAIGLRLGRTPIAIRGKAQREGISLRPTRRRRRAA